MMIQISNAIAAHRPSRNRKLDISHLKDHLLRIATDLVNSITESYDDFETSSAKFIFGGYSWRNAEFMVWTFSFDTKQKSFVARPSNNFHDRIGQAAFIGDWATRFRGKLVRHLNELKTDFTSKHEPLAVLANLLRTTKITDSIGGAPQVVRIGAHMNSRTFCVPWNGKKTLFGRTLFDYENCDYWSIDPDNGRIEPPPPIRRSSENEEEPNDEHG